MNTYYVELNFSGSNTIDTGIAVSQGDYGKVQLSIACKKDGQFISDAESAEIIFQTEKGKVINGDLTGSGGLYGYVFQGNELQDPGKLVATVTLHYEDGQTSSESFLMAVRYNPLYDQNLQAGPYITQLEKLQAQAQGYVDYIGAIIEQLRQDIGETALTKADLQNDFAQSQSGIKALDAALGPQILQKSNIVNNLLATITGNVLDATQGKVLDEKITQLYSNIEKTGILSFPRFTAFTENVSDMLKSPLCISHVSINTGESDPHAPITTEGPHWWNVITVGIANRCEQLAFRGYSPSLTSEVLYLRRQHDNSTSQWIQIK